MDAIRNTQYDLVYAALLALSVAGAAAVFRLLTFSGALAAFAVGFLIFAFGGPVLTVALLAFFFSSSLLSRIGRAKKEGSLFAKGATRDWLQVLANGLLPAVMGVIFNLRQHERIWLMLGLASLAAVNADTWATEIGSLAQERPRMITTFKPVSPGESGAISWLGLFASIAGAVFIPICALLSWRLVTPHWGLYRIDVPEIMSIAWAGFMASYADSLLGATLQAQYRCPRCGLTTESREHCGVIGRVTRGLAFMTNDTVNLAASVCGIGFGWILLQYFAYPR